MSWLPKRTIVVPIDFSDESFDALTVAKDLTPDPAGLHIVHVLIPIHPVEPGVVWGTVSDEERTRHALAALDDKLAGTNVEGAARHIRLGNPGKEIVALANEVDADLIVMPSHGRGRIERFLLGSVAERTLRLAKCPVLILKDG